MRVVAMGGWKMQPVINKKWYGKCLEDLKLRIYYILITIYYIIIYLH